jgi:hypothetical protein
MPSFSCARSRGNCTKHVHTAKHGKESRSSHRAQEAAIVARLTSGGAWRHISRLTPPSRTPLPLRTRASTRPCPCRSFTTRRSPNLRQDSPTLRMSGTREHFHRLEPPHRAHRCSHLCSIHLAHRRLPAMRRRSSMVQAQIGPACPRTRLDARCRQAINHLVARRVDRSGHALSS